MGFFLGIPPYTYVYTLFWFVRFHGVMNWLGYRNGATATDYRSRHLDFCVVVLRVFWHAFFFSLPHLPWVFPPILSSSLSSSLAL